MNLFWGSLMFYDFLFLSYTRTDGQADNVHFVRGFLLSQRSQMLGFTRWRLPSGSLPFACRLWKLLSHSLRGSTWPGGGSLTHRLWYTCYWFLQAAAIMSQRARNAGNEDEVPSIILTIANVHPSHVADARFYLRREIQAAEAAGAKIVIKVGWFLSRDAMT